MEDELEANRRRTLMKEWKDVADSPRYPIDELENNRRRCLMKEWKTVADSPRYRIDEIEYSEMRRREREAEHERIDQENARVFDWLRQKQYEDDASEPVRAGAAAEQDDSWNRWFDGRFRDLMRPVLEAVGEEIGKSLDEERKQSREELALEVQRLNSEATRLFAIIAELQQTIAALNRVKHANERDDDLALAQRPARHGVH
jgi:hypothetical protein